MVEWSNLSLIFKTVILFWNAYNNHLNADGTVNSYSGVYNNQELQTIANTESFNYGVPSGGQWNHVPSTYYKTHQNILKILKFVSKPPQRINLKVRPITIMVEIMPISWNRVIKMFKHGVRFQRTNGKPSMKIMLMILSMIVLIIMGLIVTLGILPNTKGTLHIIKGTAITNINGI